MYSLIFESLLMFWFRTSSNFTFIFELCDKDCPEDYKRIVQQEILKDNARD